ncbi:YlxR family protein [Thermosulfuriphilus sp.]
MCVFCRRHLPKAELHRLVVREGVVFKDERKVLAGRGAYVCPECWSEVFRRRGRRILARAFRLSPEEIKDIRADCGPNKYSSVPGGRG